MPHLHALIHRLSKQEKRYLKLFDGRQQKGGSNYMRLFDLIHAQKVYDEKAIRQTEKLQSEKWIKNFPTTKYELYQLVLRSLHAFYAKSNEDSRLEEMVHQAEILYNKRLYQQCGRLLDKAEKLSRKLERFRALLGIIDLRRKLIRITVAPVKKEAEIELLCAEELRVLQTLRMEAQMKRYYAEIQSMTLWKSVEKQELRVERSRKLLENYLRASPKGLSYLARLYYHDVRSSCLHNLDKLEAGIAELEEMVAALEANPQLLGGHMQDYVRAQTKLMLFKSDFRDYENYPELLGKLWGTVEGADLPEDMRMQVFLRANMTEMLYRNYVHAFEGIMDLTKRLEAGFVQYGDSVPASYKGVLLSQITWLLLCAGLPKEALRIGNQMWLENEKTGLQSFDSQTKILQIITHFELGNDDLLPYLLRSLYRRLRRLEETSPLEKNLMDFFQHKLPGVSSQAGLKKVFASMLADLEAQADHPLVKGRLMFWDFRIWLRQKMDQG
ncbi:MAG TPA: hypothetical protein ENJ82_15585 [Bacteroidetes bacterium]|nr:hypothetical protein [Bacteroidota bacterium]